ncbi:hypothetical protein HMPREF9571_01180 [Cutibacterium acnes HL043PA2]|nr:hypothetical protein HMPREF9571_01180 [Cutibacterium acnes HL043PA2]
MGCMSETTVTKNDQQSRYEAYIGGELAGSPNSDARGMSSSCPIPKHSKPSVAKVSAALWRASPSTTLLARTCRCVRTAPSSKGGWTSTPTTR